MNKRRLRILRDALIAYAKAPGNLVFDLKTWANIPKRYADQAERAVCDAALGKNFCGTTACAMGLATTIPSFRRAGLRLIVERNQWSNEFRIDVAFGGADDGFDAAQEFFGLHWDDTIELFSPSNYRRGDRKNPLIVAEKTTALLECA